MTRVIGFLLLQAASIVYAVQYGRTRKKQLEGLTSWCDMLQQLRGILEADAPPMPELLQTLARRSRGDACDFILGLQTSLDRLGKESFQELWNQALREKASSFEEDIAHELETLGTVLGHYDIATQLQAVETCQAMLLKYTGRLREELPQSSRLTFGLLISATLMLGILLI